MRGMLGRLTARMWLAAVVLLLSAHAHVRARPHHEAEVGESHKGSSSEGIVVSSMLDSVSGKGEKNAFALVGIKRAASQWGVGEDAQEQCSRQEARMRDFSLLLNRGVAEHMSFIADGSGGASSDVSGGGEAELGHDHGAHGRRADDAMVQLSSTSSLVDMCEDSGWGNNSHTGMRLCSGWRLCTLCLSADLHM